MNIFQIIEIVTNLFLLVLLIFYFFYLRVKEKALNSKQNKIDSDYHKIIEDALSRERKILDDTTEEANQIISGAQYVSDVTKTALNEALAKMVSSLEQGTHQTSQEFVNYYLSNLKQMTHQSLVNFQGITHKLEIDLEKQIQDYHNTILPNLNKEVETYKLARLKQVDQSIQRIVQKVSQEVLNKSISIEDHEKLILETLEKAKAEGVFE
jgi:F0F1-type ATP synthase membrane subunit b/b'